MTVSKEQHSITGLHPLSGQAGPEARGYGWEPGGETSVTPPRLRPRRAGVPSATSVSRVVQCRHVSEVAGGLTATVSSKEVSIVSNVIGIVLGFALTTVAGGWWAHR